MVLKIKLQVYCGTEVAIGPGKADLLDAIVSAGSISGAGRTLGMSYRRAWLLVDAMNRCWAQPLVSTAPGAGKGSGAKVTELGRTVLAEYRAMQAAATGAAQAGDWTALSVRLRNTPLVHQHSGD